MLYETSLLTYPLHLCAHRNIQVSSFHLNGFSRRETPLVGRLFVCFLLFSSLFSRRNRNSKSLSLFGGARPSSPTPPNNAQTAMRYIFPLPSLLPLLSTVLPSQAYILCAYYCKPKRRLCSCIIYTQSRKRRKQEKGSEIQTSNVLEVISTNKKRTKVSY